MPYSEKISKVINDVIGPALFDAGARILHVQGPEKSNSVHDAVLSVQFNLKVVKFLCDYKADAFPIRIRPLLMQWTTQKLPKNTYPLLLSRFLSPTVRSLCRSYHVNYADETGNIWLAFPGFVVDRNVEPRKKEQREKRIHRSLFSPKATRIVRVLLNNPQQLWSQTRIASEAKLSIGHVNKVVRKLQEQGYVEILERKIYLKSPIPLLEDWQSNYHLPEGLPFFTLESRDAFEKHLDDYCHRNDAHYALTMFAGASHRVPYTRFQMSHIYFAGDIKMLGNEMQLKDVSSGPNLIVYLNPDSGIFYGINRIDDVNVVSDLQLYLDLKTSDLVRSEEQANLILQQYLPMLSIDAVSNEANFQRFLKFRNDADAQAKEKDWLRAFATYEKALGYLEKVKRPDEREQFRALFLQWLIALEGAYWLKKKEYFEKAKLIFPESSNAEFAVKKADYNSAYLKYALFLSTLLMIRYGVNTKKEKARLQEAAVDYVDILLGQHASVPEEVRSKVREISQKEKLESVLNG